MQVVKKGLVYFLVGVLIVLSLGACGNSGSEQENGTSTGESTVSTAKSDLPEKTPESIDPYGKYDQTITINISRSVDPTEKLPEGDTPEDNQYTRYVKDVLNIETKTVWTAAQGKDYDQKVNLSIASNDLPDAMCVNQVQMKQMVKAGSRGKW